MSDELLRACSWNGDGKNVYCARCCNPLDAKTIRGMDADGNAYCQKCSKPKEERT
jgi:hypothetical protein